MADMDIENNSSYGAMERFLIWFLIPFVFTAVLLGVLLTIFDYDVMNSVLKAAKKVPVISSVVPEPKSKAGDSKTTTKPDQKQDESVLTSEEKLQSISTNMAQKDQEIQQSESAILQRDQSIKELQAKNSALEEQVKSKAKSDEEYTNQIQQLATLYAKMSPSKAAPIMQNLTTSELVLVLSMMKTDERVKVLEKMDPKKAADASILLKDQTPAKDKQIAALQERLKTMPDQKSTQKLSKDDLGSTFSNMAPKSAATVLLEMQNNNPDKVISILSSMDSAGRSKIITAIAEQSKETAALISTRLVQ